MSARCEVCVHCKSISHRLKGAAAGAGIVIALAAGACGDDGAGQRTPTAIAPAPTAVAATPPAAPDVVSLRGRLTLDGVPVETQFLGARVVRADGLAAVCQRTIPAVTGGSYAVDVLPDSAVRGCGTPGASVLLWIFTGNAYYFSGESLPWPDEPGAVSFDATFSTADRAGASKPVTGFKGHLFASDGAALPVGTVVEAYAGDVRCGVTSLRGEEVEFFYALIVAGPESVPGCGSGAPLSFRLNGAPAVETAVNDLRSDPHGHELDLTLKE